MHVVRWRKNEARNVTRAPRQEIILGVVAGWWVGLTCIMVLIAAGGFPAYFRELFPSVPKIITGIFFPLGIW